MPSIFPRLFLVVSCGFYLSSVQGAEPANFWSCGNNAQALTLAKLIMEDVAQERTTLRCNELLAKAAMEKALDMADFGIVRHNLGGSPNSRLRDAGFELPVYYGGAMSNQVEAIAGGYPTAEAVWKAFKGSSAHRSHLLGEIDFYREQDQLGVGFVREHNSPHVEYWVVYLSRQKDRKSVPGFDEIPNKGIDILVPEDRDGVSP